MIPYSNMKPRVIKRSNSMQLLGYRLTRRLSNINIGIFELDVAMIGNFTVLENIKIEDVYVEPVENR
jgi:hypothetical protein